VGRPGIQRDDEVQKWARRVTGVLFIGLGIYESLRSIFGVL